MRKNRKKQGCFKFILTIIIFSFLISFIQNINYIKILSKFIDKELIYKNISENQINTYKEIGQEKIEGKDGYTTTFSSVNKVYKEYKQNGNSSWSQKEYWGGTMENNGCGITTMAIILSGYGYNETPEDLRNKYFPVMDYEKLGKELEEKYKIQNTGFCKNIQDFSKNKIINHLILDKPIIVCVWAKYKENRWTEKSHYMALLATDGIDKVYISNPNGIDDKYNNSGWYNIEEILPYIAKILFIES